MAVPGFRLMSSRDSCISQALPQLWIENVKKENAKQRAWEIEHGSQLDRKKIPQLPAPYFAQMVCIPGNTSPGHDCHPYNNGKHWHCYLQKLPHDPCAQDRGISACIDTFTNNIKAGLLSPSQKQEEGDSHQICKPEKPAQMNIKNTFSENTKGGIISSSQKQAERNSHPDCKSENSFLTCDCSRCNLFRCGRYRPKDDITHYCDEMTNQYWVCPIANCDSKMTCDSRLTPFSGNDLVPYSYVPCHENGQAYQDLVWVPYADSYLCGEWLPREQRNCSFSGKSSLADYVCTRCLRYECVCSEDEKAPSNMPWRIPALMYRRGHSFQSVLPQSCESENSKSVLFFVFLIAI